jgi:hypothetical protein
VSKHRKKRRKGRVVRPQIGPRERRELAVMIEDQVRSIAETHDFSLVVRLVKHNTTRKDTPIWTFYYQKVWVLDYFPGSGTTWDPINRVKSRAINPVDALVCAMKSANVDVPVCLRDVKG